MSFYVRVCAAPSAPDCYWEPESDSKLNNGAKYTAVVPQYHAPSELDDNTGSGAGRRLRIYVQLKTTSGPIPQALVFTQLKGHGQWAAQKSALDTLVLQTANTTESTFVLTRPDLYNSDIRAFMSFDYVAYAFSSAMARNVLGKEYPLTNAGYFTLEWQLGHGVVMSGVDYYIKTDTLNGYRLKAQNDTLTQSLDTNYTTYFRFEHCDGTTPELLSTTYSIMTGLGWYVCVGEWDGAFESRDSVREWEQFTLYPSPTQDGRMVIFTQWPPYDTVYMDQRYWSFSMTTMWTSGELYTAESPNDALAYNQCFDIHPVIAG